MLVQLRLGVRYGKVSRRLQRVIFWVGRKAGKTAERFRFMDPPII